MKTIELKRGDPCPRCGGFFKPARVPTDAEFAHAFDRENPGTLPENADTASPDQRAALGVLHRCPSCGYQTRFEAAPAPAADQKVA